ncbi:hypothetical protein G8759_20160 [Spirosoma aureum]|uniref:Uncharacterized protein n=1 Tax=Spirosoma aureum TaxID=2692134 RepID=A0A6G9AQL6_9BACT|nr:hypothetical protein [Spirosoma aureum]QIP14767.1 hypothetical protein G8759_20160 [Spirosoma aureum]
MPDQQSPTPSELERQIREFDRALFLFVGRNFHKPAIQQQKHQERDLF